MTEPMPVAHGLTLPELCRRTVDGRGVADIRLLQVEDGPGRGQRLLLVRNALGLCVEIAVDRGFDISSATWRGINIGWNSANALPWPPHSVDAEDGLGFYRNLDGFIVTCGLDHLGGPRQGEAHHYIHSHRKKTFHPLHGRISSQRASLSGFGIDWTAQTPVIWAEGIVRQSAVFGENLVLHRRLQIDVQGSTIRLDDTVENRGFRPTPHAMLYHVNFGFPFLDDTIEMSGDVPTELAGSFNTEDKRPHDNFVDHYRDVPITADQAMTSVELRNPALLGGTSTSISFSRAQLPGFGMWRAFQSGVYALAVEPSRQSQILGPAETASYRLHIGFSS